jgi:hypothetical protein
MFPEIAEFPSTEWEATIHDKHWSSPENSFIKNNIAHNVRKFIFESDYDNSGTLSFYTVTGNTPNLTKLYTKTPLTIKPK